MPSSATSVEQYLADLPEDRRHAISVIREVILKNLPKGYEEGMQYGMIGYCVPHSVYPDGYHCDPKQPLPFASLGSQKNHMALYMMSIYGDPKESEWFRKAWTSTGKKLDAGKSCVRFKKLEDVPLAVVGQAIKRVPVKKYVAFYESSIKSPSSRSSGNAAKKKKATTKKAPPKKVSSKKAVTKKSAASKKVSAKKASAKKVSGKKVLAKKTTSKKPAVKKKVHPGT